MWNSYCGTKTRDGIGPSEYRNQKCRKSNLSTDGYTGDTYCTDCGKRLSSGAQVAKAGHTIVTDKAVAATCTTEGKTEGSHCSACNTVFTEQQTIPATGHQHTEVRNANVAMGYAGYVYCLDCGRVLSSGTINRSLLDNLRTRVKISLTKANYTGRAICPEVQVSFDGITLLEDIDYQVSYANNIDVGTGTIIVEGMGIYSGTIERNFSITMTPGKIYTDGNCNYRMIDTGEMAFCGIADGAMKKATIPNIVVMGGAKFVVTAIENKAFMNTDIVSVSVGANVNSIGDNAFSGCKKLKKIVIPANVKKIGKKAFYGCKKLETITVKTNKLTNKNIGSKAFAKTSQKIVVKVPKNKVKAYKKLFRAKGLSKKAILKKG